MRRYQVSDYTDDEREALIADRKVVLDVLNATLDLPLDAVSAQVVMALTGRRFRRQGPITDAQVAAVAQYLRDAGLMPLGWTGETYALAALEAAREAS
jgi:hypothetical protein